MNKVTCSQTHLSPHTHISNIVCMCPWNRWKVCPTSVVFLQVAFWSRRVSAPVWPCGRCSQGFALTLSVTMKEHYWFLYWTHSAKQGNWNRPDKACSERTCPSLYNVRYAFIVNIWPWFSSVCVKFWTRASSDGSVVGPVTLQRVLG